MPREDWLVGGDRRAIATDRIYAAAGDLIAHGGLDALDIDRLADLVHCSRATVYRYAGGKAQIRDAVLARAASRIIGRVRAGVADLAGQERVVTAIVLALELIRSDPLAHLMLASVRGADEMAWLTGSPILAGFAADLAGLAGGDPHAAQWVVRVVLSLMCWPVEDDRAEYQLVQRFVAPAFAPKG